MVFSSLTFLFRFLAPVILFYFIVPKRFRNFVLLLASLVFYAWGEPIYLFLMLASIVMNYFCGLWVAKEKERENRKKARIAVAVSVIFNLAILCFFKYADFTLSNVNALFGTHLKLLKLALPIGISFYTFQSMSYPIDVYRGDASKQKNLITFGTYVALFPQLIAGPIVRYKTIEDQLNGRAVTIDKVASGIRRFVVGLCKKVLLANSIGALWKEILATDLSSLTVLTAWIGALAFTFQIYFDFSGYSDMAIGLGRIFGFEFLENFNYPYLAKSITDFWRRWHISLSTWFREYLYIPLGGNRKGRAVQIRNLLIVWALTGFWHGAGWSFVIWGLYFACLLILEKLFLEKLLEKIPRLFSHLYTLFFVIVSWVIFAFGTAGDLVDSLAAQNPLALTGTYLSAMFSGPLYDTRSLYYLASYAILFVILVIASTRLPKILRDKCYAKLERFPALAGALSSVVLIAAFALCVAYLVDGTYNPFLYFQF